MAQGVLAQLKVVIGADVTKLSSGLNEAQMKVAQSGKKIEWNFRNLGSTIGKLFGPLSGFASNLSPQLAAIGASAGTAAQGLGSMAGPLGMIGGAGIAGVGALGAGLFALAEHAAQAGAAIYDASEKTGISASDMSGLAAISKETGGNFDALSISLARAGANLNNALINPSTIGARELKQLLGGAQGLTELGLKPMGERLQIVTQKAFALHDIGQRNAILQSLLGRGWMQNVETLKMLATQGYGPAIAEAKKLGVFYDSAAARQAKEFTESMSTMKGELSAVGLVVGQKVIPYFEHWMEGLQGMGPRLEAFGLRLAGVLSATSLVGIPLAKKLFAEADEKSNEADQAQTDFQVHIDSMVAGYKASHDSLGNLASGKHGGHKGPDAGMRSWTDAMKELGRARERAGKEYAGILAELTNRTGNVDAATVKYNETLAKLNAISLQGVDVTKALTLARRGYDDEITKSMAEANASFAMPATMPGGFLPGAKPLPTLTLSRIAALPSAFPDNSLATMKALKKETELSAASFAQLAKAFPNLSEAEVAALPAGQQMIDQLAHMEKHGKQAMMTLHDLREQLIAEGNNLSGNLVQSLGSSVHEAEGQLTNLLTGRKFNFVSVAQNLGQSVMGSFLQKGLGSMLGKFGLGGKKRDGMTAGSALYVIPTDESGTPLASITGSGLGKLIPGFGQKGGKSGSLESGLGGLFKGGKGFLGDLESGLGGLFKGAGGGFLGVLGKIGGLFGGFLAGGGDVTPGKAYVVGEHHPEFFVPRASGRVVPTLKTGGSNQRPLVFSPVYNISTPNPDAFRKSQSQLITEGYRQAALAHARNS